MDKKEPTRAPITVVQEPKKPSATNKTSKPKGEHGGKKKAGIIILVVGIVSLVAGLVFLLINLLKAPLVRDADYLVEIGAWQSKDGASVIWTFTEIGKGTLTTNAHTNDYAFLWEMNDDTLKIETTWLYTLNDIYTYELDQKEQVLTLTSGENTYTFVPAERPAEQKTERSGGDQTDEKSAEES